jgi:DnaJ-class molecular chaperone
MRIWRETRQATSQSIEEVWVGPCPQCEGTGWAWGNMCPMCKGTTTVRISPIGQIERLIEAVQDVARALRERSQQ